MNTGELPPAAREWEGRTVRWMEWHVTPRSAHLEAVLPSEPCVCGSTDAPLMAGGLLLPNEGESFTTHQVKNSHRTGREYEVPVQVPAWPVLRLLAFRCQHCGAEEVLDPESS